MQDLDKQPVKIANLFNKYDLIKANEFRKFDYPFQKLCSENQEKYGRAIWTLPNMKGCTDEVLREALKVCTSKGIETFPYLKGCVKKLIK